MTGVEWLIMAGVAVLLAWLIWPRSPRVVDDPRCYECRFENGVGSGRYCSRCGGER